jgi:DNA processing protein
VATLTAAPARPPVRPPDRALDRLLRRLAGSALARLEAGERDRRAGWARTALATIRRAGLHVLTPEMAEYPPRFRELEEPPEAVFALGRLELMDTPMVAVVGTRKCTAYGRGAAQRIAGGLAGAGVTVVSGLALGIDGEAHRAAGAERTIAVLGCGLDVPYPLRHRDIQRDIARRGLLLSEQLPGAPASPQNFPARNRMIAALGLGLVVVEAPFKSGAMGTVRHALALGRPVFAVPGPTSARTSDGTNELIQDGAILVTGAREVLDVLRLPIPADTADPDHPPLELHGVGLALWRALGPEPRHVDEVAGLIGMEPHQSLASLLALEIQGHARQLAGMRFVRSVPDAQAGA